MNEQKKNFFAYPLLTEKEVIKLINKAHHGDVQAREKLINSNLRLVMNIVKRFEGRGDYEREELFQIGVIGLIKAVDNFDPKREVMFSTYAVPMIIGEVRRFLRDDQPLKASRALREVGYKAKKVREKLIQELGREPTLGELAQRTELTKEEIVMALEAIQTPLSIYEPSSWNDGDSLCVLDHLGVERDGEAFWCEQISLKEAIANLPEHEQQVILMRFFQDKTQHEVAQSMGLSQVQISRLEHRAMEKLKKLLVT